MAEQWCTGEKRQTELAINYDLWYSSNLLRSQERDCSTRQQEHSCAKKLSHYTNYTSAKVPFRSTWWYKAFYIHHSWGVAPAHSLSESLCCPPSPREKFGLLVCTIWPCLAGTAVTVMGPIRISLQEFGIMREVSQSATLVLDLSRCTHRSCGADKLITCWAVGEQKLS